MVQAPGVQDCPPTPSPWEGTRGWLWEGHGKNQRGPRRQQWTRGRIMGEGVSEAIVSGAEVDLSYFIRGPGEESSYQVRGPWLARHQATAESLRMHHRSPRVQCSQRT